MKDSKDALEIALKLSDVVLRNLQFFIAICTVVCGWVIATSTVSEFEIWQRLALCAVFSAPTIGLTIGGVQTIRRLNSALEIARNNFDAEEHGDLKSADLGLFENANPKIAGRAMAATLVMINVLILFR